MKSFESNPNQSEQNLCPHEENRAECQQCELDRDVERFAVELEESDPFFKTQFGGEAAETLYAMVSGYGEFANMSEVEAVLDEKKISPDTRKKFTERVSKFREKRQEIRMDKGRE